jgi:hypothetical protein
MDWFFTEYVYGTEYPSYKFNHSFTRDAEGNLVLNFKLTQSGVGQEFVMLVPVYLDMGHEKVSRVGWARMTGNSTLERQIVLKGLKEKPKRAVAAYYDDVLGSFENK